MSKIGLVIKHEYTQRVAKKSFLILTLLMPILFLALILVPLGLAQLDSSETQTIAIVDNTGKYAKLFESDEEFHFVSADIPTASLQEQSEENGYDAIVVINKDLIENEDGVTIYSNQFVNNRLERYVENLLSDYAEQERIDSYNIPDLKEIMEKTHANIEVRSIKWDKNGEEESGSSEMAMGVGFIFTMMMYMFVFVYGAQVMNSVMQEKTSRIVEVLVCSVKPYELMMGKIISVALVGLTQIAIWIVLTGSLLAVFSPILSSTPEAAMETASTMIEQNPEMSVATESMMQEVMGMLSGLNFAQLIICFIIYFVGGYLLYSSFFAAIGSAVDSETDTQQFMLPITIPILFGLYAAMYSAENPDGPLAFWCSLIPFTSPIVMMVRLPYGVPMWQLLVSIVLLGATFIGAVWLSAKIYRTGILMYGKKVTWKELIKWLRY